MKMGKNFLMGIFILSLSFSGASISKEIQDLDEISLGLQERQKELNIPTETIKKLRKFEDEKRRAFSGLRGIYVSKRPKYATLKSIRTIFLHPAYQVVLNFDNRYVVRYATTSTQMVKFSVSDNSIIIQPPKDFIEGSLSIILEDLTTKKRVVADYLIRNYDDTSGLDSEPFYLVYQFVKGDVLSPYEVIDEYFKLKGKYPEDSVSFISINGIGYKIIKVNNNVNGVNIPAVRINGNTYLVYSGVKF